jgi:hypothetical protein
MMAPPTLIKHPTWITLPTRLRASNDLWEEKRAMNARSSGIAFPEFRRRHIMVIGAVSAAGLMLSPTTSRGAGASGSTFVYVGSYTKDPPGGGSNNPVGLSVFKFDPSTGALSPVQQPERTGALCGERAEREMPRVELHAQLLPLSPRIP